MNPYPSPHLHSAPRDELVQEEMEIRDCVSIFEFCLFASLLALFRDGTITPSYLLLSDSSLCTFFKPSIAIDLIGVNLTVKATNKRNFLEAKAEAEAEADTVMAALKSVVFKIRCIPKP